MRIENKREEVEDFFNFFLKNPKSAISNEQDIDNYIKKMQRTDYTPYICNYIFENLDNIWSFRFGLESPYAHERNRFVILHIKAPDLYNKIDILCSIIFKIMSSDENNNKKISNFNYELKEVNKNLSVQKNNLENELNNQKDNILSEIKSLIYPEIITILGIFTAITFAIFGGMNLLTNLFKNIGSSPASLGQTMILAAIFGLIMWGIIELLFYWISKIKGITNITKDKNKTYFNWLAIGVLAMILILGILLFTKTIK